MTLSPVPASRIQIAVDFGLENAGTAALACRDAGLPYYAACALLQMESNGRNVYGHDVGGVRPGNLVSASNFFEFIVQVMNGSIPNGVGPCQITYAGPLSPDGHRDGGYFRQMSERHLRPWIPHDNMEFGFGIMAGHFKRTHSWAKAGRLYNGSTAYGTLFEKRVQEWHTRFFG